MSYITKDFLLNNEYAKALYNEYAKDEPIFDYHCHLSEKQILADEPFKDIFEIWLSGDHYKWRLMRNYGIDEEYITGNKSNKEKFVAYCKVLSTAFGNPLYHWSQIELEKYFNCTLEINEENALKIWDECNEYIIKNKLTPSKIIENSNVKCLFTTNEIFDDLSTFDEINKKGYSFKVIPAFRADKIMFIEATKYNEFVNKLGNIKSLDELELCVENRLKDFIAYGTVASDTALQSVYEVSKKEDAAKVFAKRREGKDISTLEANVFKGYFTYYLLKLYAKYNIKCELHIGAMRNNNDEMLFKLGLDTGYDSISEEGGLTNLAKLFNKLNNEHSLPRVILFNLNPKMNVELLTLMGCFQDGSVKGKIQYGASWWFLDNKVYIEKHLQDLTSLSHIGSFLGMLTDSRSFISYGRHDYFRRILCNYLGTLMSNKEVTSDINLVGKVVKDISFSNCWNYFFK